MNKFKFQCFKDSYTLLKIDAVVYYNENNCLTNSSMCVSLVFWSSGLCQINFFFSDLQTFKDFQLTKYRDSYELYRFNEGLYLQP